jgi:hypothetical protein
MKSMDNRLLVALIACVALSGFAQDKPRNSDIENIGRRSINQGSVNFISVEKEIAVDNEAELAFVLAQRVAHVAARHGMENASKAELVNFSSPPLVFQGGQGGLALRVPAQCLETVRQQVREADFLGLQYLYKAGYEPRAAITFIQTLQGLKPPADRITTNQTNIDLILPPRAQNVLTTPEFDSIKAQLRTQ